MKSRFCIDHITSEKRLAACSYIQSFTRRFDSASRPKTPEGTIRSRVSRSAPRKVSKFISLITQEAESTQPPPPAMRKSVTSRPSPLST